MPGARDCTIDSSQTLSQCRENADSLASSPSQIGTCKIGADAAVIPHGVEVSEMSAPNPNPGEREFDAVRRAQRAHEPSMEEILASIRAIIADDREGESPRATPNRASNPTAYPTREAAYISGVDSAPAKDEALMPPEGAHAQESAIPVGDREGPPAVRMRPAEVEPSIAPVPEPESKPASAPVDQPDLPLLSEAADEAVTASFEALSSTVALNNSELVETLTREMLRPMIKTWLDENLPSLVERLVRAEIQRVARGTR
jgi:cell pole-organizing protein PopZ